ncbi:MAG: metallophosphoesterase [Lachnospiraceae bacterium]|nr:metallophosphoesterase [Lachnospiraceae bacterium]
MEIVIGIVIAAIIIVFTIILIRDSTRFVAAEYRVCSDKLHQSCRAVMLSDLHDKKYGRDNQKLLQAIDGVAPDLVLIGGDMVTANGEKTDDTVAMGLIKQLAKKYPVYYGMGNHEYRIKIMPETYGDRYERYKRELKACGVRMLENERVFLPRLNLEICGVEIDRTYYKRFKHKQMKGDYLPGLLGRSRQDCFELLLAHNPDYFKEYAAWGADLVLSGHIHGGVVKVPFLGGLISPMMHLFPKYDGGRFEEGDSSMILGRGLGMHTIPLRFLNPGELVVLHLEPLEGCKR